MPSRHRPCQSAFASSVHNFLGLGRVLSIVLALWVAVCGAPAHAQALQSIAFVPAIGTLKATPSAGVLYAGALVYTYSYPTTASSGSVFYGLPLGSTRRLLAGMTNLYIAATGTPSYLRTSGSGCPVNTKSGTQPAMGTDISTVFAIMNAVCTFTITLPVVITKDAGAVTGTFPGTQFRASATTQMPCGAQTVGWVVWWIEGGTCPAYSAPGAGSSVPGYPTIPYVNIGCTLSPAVYTVNLPTAAATSLNTSGAFTTPPVPLNITFTGCGWSNTSIPSVVASATWSFTPIGAANDAIATGITNLGVQILDPNGNPVVNGSTTTLGTVLRTSPTLTSTHGVRYIAVGGAAGTGSFTNATATFNLSYN